MFVGYDECFFVLLYVCFNCFCSFGFFFFKQKTAYEMLRSLVGSEMCIRDRLLSYAIFDISLVSYTRRRDGRQITQGGRDHSTHTVSYTHLTLPTIYSV